MYPASYLSTHEHPITDINFHRTEPTKLFTSSEGGELFQWSHNAIQTNGDNINNIDIDNLNPWLSGERTKNKINVCTIMLFL